MSTQIMPSVVFAFVVQSYIFWHSSSW